MAIIGEFGLEAESLGDWIQHYENVYRNALGEDTSTDAATAIGRIIREKAMVAVKIDELATWIAAGLNLYQASGRQLTDYATLMGIPFNEGSRSTVTVTATGVASTIIPAGSRIRTAAGAIFETSIDAVIESAGTVDILCRSQQIGPIHAAAGALTEIMDIIAGWDSVTNTEAAVAGIQPESETEWVERYLNRMAIHGQGTLENIAARVREVDGIRETVVLHNPVSLEVTDRGFTQDANSFSVIISGDGTAADIARAIADTAPPGIPMTGSQTHDLDGVTYRWTPATLTAIAVTITTRIEIGVFPADGRAQIVAGLLRFIGNLRIGQEIDLTRLRAVTANIPGHIVQTFEVTLQNGNVLPDTTVTTLWTLDENDISLTFST